MKILKKHFTEPLNVIIEQPYQFVVWTLVAILFGLSGFWLPLLATILKGSLTYALLKNAILSGSLASFSVVILADGIATMLVTVGAGTNPIASGLRGLVGIAAFLLAAIHIALTPTTADVPNYYVCFQIFITVLAIILASYLYCFRSPSWEKGLDEVKKEQEKEVAKLGEAAESMANDKEGTAL